MNGCTKSVPLSKNTTTTILNSEIDASVETGDGASVLFMELAYDYAYDNLVWKSGTSADYLTEGGWGTSRIRAMLNGADELTDMRILNKGNIDINSYTPENCLLATFPQELQEAIGRRKVKYDSAFGSNEESNLKSSADKLWLLSLNELGESFNGCKYGTHPLEGNLYPKFAGIGNLTDYSSCPRLIAYTYNGGTRQWRVRSIDINLSKNTTPTIETLGQLEHWHASRVTGVAPCFTLKR